ncbi:MAG: right-handed parallel beta-helix repeat-containing protein [Labilithrix sp.]|nr:right-handed parallel beta-helix repeat-containing protein [Labilithrix sp.]MCW5809759.1 right-handed parallel beta-helix repeat-containing protein [Labilithrix sp.]
MSRRSLRTIFAFCCVALLSSSAAAETRTVGAGKQHASLAEALEVVAPGDVVEVYDDETYPTTGEGGAVAKRHGSPTGKITIRGMKNAQGKRVKLSGGKQGALFLQGNHYVVEGFEITNGTETCVTLRANDVTIRDSVVHDCPRHGILALDEGMGSLTLEYVEVYKAGLEEEGQALKHPIYVSSDANPTTGFPGSVFRMEHCYVHDARDGNNVKSRAERNEIRFNWIEGAGYYELELIGPDLAQADVARHSEVIGNVFFKTNARSHMVRIGSDGSANSNGRYRFVNNTFILSATTEGLLRAEQVIDSLEFTNNVGWRFGRSINSVFRRSETEWLKGTPRISGANNWFPTGSEDVPEELEGTILGGDPGFTSTSPLDLRPKANGALADKGTATSPSPEGAAFPNPFAIPPAFVPGQRAVPRAGSPLERPRSGAPDIGAYEVGSDAPPGSAGAEEDQPAPGEDPSAEDGDDDDDRTSGRGKTRDIGTCGCRFVGARGERAALAFGLAVVALAYARRRRQG